MKKRPRGRTNSILVDITAVLFLLIVDGMIALLVIISALYAWQLAAIDQPQQVLEFQPEIPVAKTENTPLATAPSLNSEARTQLIPRSELGGICAYEYLYDQSEALERRNDEPADRTVAYSNQAKGLSVQLPFNPNWGTEQCGLVPYEESKYENTVEFGPVSGCEGGGVCRYQDIRLLPAKTAEQVRIELVENELSCFGCSPLFMEITEKTINGLSILEYIVPGLCNSVTVQVVGKKHNYELQMCGRALENNVFSDFQYLEGIVKTMELI